MVKNVCVVAAAVTLLFCLGTAASAQSAEFLDDLIFQETARFGQAALLVLISQGVSPDLEDEEEAAREVIDRGWTAEPQAATDSVTLGQYSFMIMKAFDIPGGLGYRLFGSPRYAARELDHLDLIRGYAGPSRRLSGEDLLRIMGNVVDWVEERS